MLYSRTRIFDSMHTPFVLLDDDTASAANPTSRLYTELAGVFTCQRSEELSALFAFLEQALQDDRHVVGWFSYELGAQLQGVDHAVSEKPLAQILSFAQCQKMDRDAVARWLGANDATENVPVGIANLHANVDAGAFDEAIEKIRAYIEAGDTYQVNYTYRLRGEVFGSPLGLYRRLRERQPTPYSALMALPDGRTVLSFSPELFLRHEKGDLTARPMKGTAPASGDAIVDAERALALSHHEKNCAENLMIVDLLRNDLGRVAQCGSVQVPTLYDVRAYGAVLQMTSTVTARLRDDATLAKIFEAMYPCGSITGAPKKRTMEIIREVEPDVRGVYTGGIGWFDKADRAGAVPNFCLSVPIRTLVLDAPDAGGVRRGELGVGAGIVYDSRAEEEYAECQLKAQFLSGLPPTVALLETMRVTRDGCALWDRHLHRLRQSAAYFGLALDESALRKQVMTACAELRDGPHRLRLSIGADGVRLQTAPLSLLQEPVRLLLADAPTFSGDLFLRHKTTYRQRYDAGWRAAEAQGAFDMLFFNERDELTEGGRSNVFVKLNGQWVTPPLSSGVLPGVMRSVLLEDPAWHASERTLTHDDLDRAEAVIVCNALRGVLRAEVVSRKWEVGSEEARP